MAANLNDSHVEFAEESVVHVLGDVAEMDVMYSMSPS